jgi:hypothetical protein
VLPKDGQEAITMRGLNEMDHLMNDHVFEQVLRLSHELRIEADVSCPMVAAPPLRLHPLKEIPSHFNVQPWLPFLDERGHDVMQECLMPVVHHIGAFLSITAWAYRESDTPMVEQNKRFASPASASTQCYPG